MTKSVTSHCIFDEFDVMFYSMRWIISLLFFFWSSLLTAEVLDVNRILRLEIHSSINPATYNYLKNAFAEAKKQDCDLVLIRLNTPGGLISTTKDILSLFGESDVPIVVWVGPSGATATSAGAIIASAAHILLMSEGTGMGAATPVQMGKDVPKDARKKAISDLVTLTQSLARSRGRNSQGLGEMISAAKSFGPQQALKKGFIDGIVNTEKELLNYLGGRDFILKGNKKTVAMKEFQLISFDMDWGQRLLNILAHPSLAYILFLLGAALIYLEFQAPGGLVAGAMGVLSLILAAIGFQVLPLNFGALGLIIASLIFFIMEIYVVSYGALSFVGLGALLTGSLFLFRTDNSYLELSQGVIFGAIGTIVLFLIFVAMVMLKTHKYIGKKRFNGAVGKSGKICDLLEKNDEYYIYQVKIGGELWRAETKNPRKPGEFCKILDQDNENMLLKI